MVALLFVFLGFFLYRLLFLLNSYVNQDEVNKNVLFNDNLNARTLNAIAEKDYYDVPHNFIKTSTIHLRLKEVNRNLIIYTMILLAMQSREMRTLTQILENVMFG